MADPKPPVEDVVPVMNCPYCDADKSQVETMLLPRSKTVLYMCNGCGKNWSRKIL